MSGYERLVRPVLFRRDAEDAHEVTLRRLATASPVLRLRRPPRVARTVFGVRFPNPVGLAAGLDKDGRALRAWPALGFGFVEVGTVTRYPQPGNPRPRLFRLPASAALINRMGFNNAGPAALAARLRAIGPLPVPLGVNIGKSKVTALDAAVEDYVATLRELTDVADYVTVNVSSPNTPGLRRLQERTGLDELLAALVQETTRPLLVKVAPDLTDAALSELLEVAIDRDVAGIVATNTTVSREGIAAADTACTREPGGLSGPPLHRRALEVVRFVARECDLPIIGVGGIDSPDAALRFLDAGASLVQIYTGLIYHGPRLVRATCRAIATPPGAAGRDET